MKVRELIERLQQLNLPNADVILQKDSEGNGYSPCVGADGDTVYIPENSWSGVVYDTKWTADDSEMEEAEWEKILAKPRCVVLFPNN